MATHFVAFALVLLPVVYFLGIVTVVRLSQVNWEDARWTQGLNRIRNAYLELSPELEPYFVTSKYDDDLGNLQSSQAMSEWPPPTQAFVAAPGVVSVISSVVAGAAAGVAAIGLDLGTAAALVLGSVFMASGGARGSPSGPSARSQSVPDQPGRALSHAFNGDEPARETI